MSTFLHFQWRISKLTTRTMVHLILHFRANRAKLIILGVAKIAYIGLFGGCHQLSWRADVLISQVSSSAPSTTLLSSATSSWLRCFSDSPIQKLQTHSMHTHWHGSPCTTHDTTTSANAIIKVAHECYVNSLSDQQGGAPPYMLMSVYYILVAPIYPQLPRRARQ